MMYDIHLPIGTNNGEGGLVCPRCGGSNLHHEIVDVYERPEDARFSTRIRCAGGAGVSIVDVPSVENPSDRRDGLVIHFSCETCDDDGDGQSSDEIVARLHIVQHKGTTYLTWSPDTMERKA